MKNIKNTWIIIAGFVLLLSACAKKESPSAQTFYGKLTVAVASFPGTPPLEVRFGGKVLGDAPIVLPGLLQEAGLSNKLAVYVKGTEQKVADTLLAFDKNRLASYKVAYDPGLGISGWVSNKPVSQDSIAFQYLNNLGDLYRAYPSYDLYLVYLDPNTGTRVETGIVLHEFGKTKLSPVITVPYYQDKAADIAKSYYLKLKNNVTGDFILFPPKSRDFILNPGILQGTSIIINLTNDDTGKVTVTPIEL